MLFPGNGHKEVLSLSATKGCWYASRGAMALRLRSIGEGEGEGGSSTPVLNVLNERDLRNLLLGERCACWDGCSL